MGASRAEGRPSPTPHCCMEFRLSLSLRVMLGIRLMWSSTQLPTQRSISARTAGSLAPESNRSFALSLQCIVHLVRRSCEGRDTIKCPINTSIIKNSNGDIYTTGTLLNSTEIEVFKPVLHLLLSKSGPEGGVYTGVKMNCPHLKLFQFWGDQSLSLSQRSVTPFYALMNLRHGVRGAATAVGAAAEHATLQESRKTHNGLGWK